MTDTIFLVCSSMPNAYRADDCSALRDTLPFQSIADYYSCLQKQPDASDWETVWGDVVRLGASDARTLIAYLYDYHTRNNSAPAPYYVVGALLSGGWVFNDQAVDLFENLGLNYIIPKGY